MSDNPTHYANAIVEAYDNGEKDLPIVAALFVAKALLETKPVHTMSVNDLADILTKNFHGRSDILGENSGFLFYSDCLAIAKATCENLAELCEKHGAIKVVK